MSSNGGSYMMGKGYLINMIGLYESVSGNAKWNEPIDLVYDDKIKFKYSREQIVKVLYDQFTAPVDEGGTDLTPGIDCEVGKVFPWCVSVGGLGMKITDKIHNTSYQTSYYRWLDWAKQNLVGGAKGSDGPYEWASIYYDRDIPYNMNGAKHQITLDLAVEWLDDEVFRGADLIAFYVPMHTATRLAARMIPKVRGLNPSAHIAAYGLYAPMNEVYLRHLGVQTVLGGEFEEGLTALAQRLERGVEAMSGEQSEPRISLARQDFVLPDRGGLPGLDRYAYLQLPNGDRRTAGYVEASRGCKHRCQHCPVVPVYNGRFRIIPRQIALEDIRQQASAGARHISFGDPDFFNGPTHALRIAMALHEELPDLTYDVTIKVEHLLAHAKLLPVLKKTGCLFVTTAVESVDDKILAILEKDHTREDFFRVVRLFDEVGLSLAPTFVAFTPWITLAGYLELLHVIAELELIRSVAPVQLTIRLLIPPGSRLLELSEVRALVGPLDEAALVYPWSNPDPEVDTLHTQVRALVQQGATKPNDQIFSEIWELAHERAGRPVPSLPAMGARFARLSLARLPQLDFVFPRIRYLASLTH